jgi:hypothetical protein
VVVVTATAHGAVGVLVTILVAYTSPKYVRYLKVVAVTATAHGVVVVLATIPADSSSLKYVMSLKVVVVTATACTFVIVIVILRQSYLFRYLHRFTLPA